MDEWSFHHWDAQILDATTAVNPAQELVRRLRDMGTLVGPRVMYTRQSVIPRLRQILLIDLGAPTGADAVLGGLRGLWLVEQEDRKVFLLGTDRPPLRWRVSGRVLLGVPVLDPSTAWFDRVAESLAMRVLGAIGREHRNSEADLFLLTQIEHALLCMGCNAFFEGLDLDVLTVVRSDGSATWETYDHYWDGSGRFRLHRVQAAQCFPLFGPLFREDWRLRRAVDRGAPLMRELTERYRVQPRTIRSVRAAIGCRVPANQRIGVLKQLDQLPAEYHPKSDDDWGVFLELTPALSDLANLLQLPFARFAEPFSTGWSCGRAALSAKLGADLDIDSIFRMMRATYRFGVRPSIQETWSAVGRAIEVAESPPQEFFPLWFGRYGLPKLASMGNRWNLAYSQFSLNRLGLQARAPNMALVWPRLLHSTTEYGPYRVVELTDRQALELEGQELEHCVASYAIKCLFLASAPFSRSETSQERH